MPTPRVTRSRSSTPLSFRTGTQSTPQSGSIAHPGSHHKTSDELALEEAASILHTPTIRLRSLDSADTDVLDGGSARALRHKRLNQVREEVEVVRERSRSPQRDEKRVEQSQGPEREEEEEEQEIGNSEQTPVDGDTDDEDDEASRELIGVSTSSDDGSTQLGEEGDTTLSAPLSAGQIFSQPREAVESGESASESDSETQSVNSSDSSSESGSDSESDSEDNSSDSDSDEDDEEERLLQAAREAAKANTASNRDEKEKANEADDEVVLRFDKEEKEA